MDRKRYEVVKYSLPLVIIAIVFSFKFFKNKEPSYSSKITKSINVENNYIITIILDNSNEKKKIGTFNSLDLIFKYRIDSDDLLYYEKNDKEVIIKDDLSAVINKYVDNDDYTFKLDWYGGNLRIRTLYKNGQFEILEEHYSAGI